MTTPALPSDQVEPLLKALSQWHYCTVIVIHGGCVFEFKGPFPAGSFSHGYYNLNSHGKGFEGHLNLAAIKQVSFQDKSHRGKESYAFVLRMNRARPFSKFLSVATLTASCWTIKLNSSKRSNNTYGLTTATEPNHE